MPWSQTSPMDQRTQFIADHLRQRYSMAALCEQYGISRKTGYKWIERYVERGAAGLQERSRPTHARSTATARYPDRFEVRYVSYNGGIRWNRDWVNVSIVRAGEYIGLEEIDDGVWNVYFGALKLGHLLERHLRIEDAYGRLKRHRY